MLGSVPAAIAEGQGPIEVCVELLGMLERAVTVNVEVQDINTTRLDFNNTEEGEGALVFGNGTASEQCFQLLISADNIIENDESFSLVLSSPIDAVEVITESAPVIIIQDSSTLEVGFSTVPTSVIEGESFMACARINMGGLSEGFQLPVNVVSLSQGSTNNLNSIFTVPSIHCS